MTTLTFVIRVVLVLVLLGMLVLVIDAAAAANRRRIHRRARARATRAFTSQWRADESKRLAVARNALSEFTSEPVSRLDGGRPRLDRERRP